MDRCPDPSAVTGTTEPHLDKTLKRLPLAHPPWCQVLGGWHIIYPISIHLLLGIISIVWSLLVKLLNFINLFHFHRYFGFAFPNTSGVGVNSGWRYDGCVERARLYVRMKFRKGTNFKIKLLLSLPLHPSVKTHNLQHYCSVNRS